MIVRNIAARETGVGQTKCRGVAGELAVGEIATGEIATGEYRRWGGRALPSGQDSMAPTWGLWRQLNNLLNATF